MDETAYHEAGHAFMAAYVGAHVQSVTIDPDWDDGPERTGDVQVEWPCEQFSEREFAEKSILVALAGPVTEMIYRGEPFHPALVAEWVVDWNLAWEAVARLIKTDRERMAYLEQSTLRLYRLLGRDEHWAALAAIADHLLAHETMEGEEVEDIMREWLE